MITIRIRIPSPLLIEFYSSNKYLKRRGYGGETKFKYHPVLNVSKNQAAEYCKWRTEMVNHLWKNNAWSVHTWTRARSANWRSKILADFGATTRV